MKNFEEENQKISPRSDFELGCAFAVLLVIFFVALLS